MNVLYLIAAIIAALAGFIGLVILIKGFIDKNNKNIKNGTIMVSIGLIIALSGAYCIGMRLAKKHDMHRQMMMECMKGCDFDMMKDCHMGDSTTTDSNGVKVCTKVIMMDKECDKSKCDKSKCEEKCKHMH